MVTACTNTGASLLLGTPVKFNSKRSAATSPIKEKELNQNRRFVNRVLFTFSCGNFYVSELTFSQKFSVTTPC